VFTMSEHTRAEPAAERIARVPDLPNTTERAQFHIVAASDDAVA
jgi:hypothetical protein